MSACFLSLPQATCSLTPAWGSTCRLRPPRVPSWCRDDRAWKSSPAVAPNNIDDMPKFQYPWPQNEWRINKAAKSFNYRPTSPVLRKIKGKCSPPNCGVPGPRVQWHLPKTRVINFLVGDRDRATLSIQVLCIRYSFPLTTFWGLINIGGGSYFLFYGNAIKAKPRFDFNILLLISGYERLYIDCSSRISIAQQF